MSRSDRSAAAASSHAAFTLLELLLVIAVIAVLVIAIVPAVNSLSKSSGRKAAVSNLLTTMEQARSVAIKDGRSTYIAFAAQPTTGTVGVTDPNLISRYFYHSYAVFEDDPSNASNKIQITPWKVLPTGISLRTEISSSSPSSYSNASWSSATFAFTPAGSQLQTFPFMSFDSTGSLTAPTGAAIGPILLRLFEGFVTGATEHPTTQANADERISIAPVTGRATYTP